MTLGQRIAVLRAGRMEQVASPSHLYERPANTFVARFIGSPPMNLLEGRVTNQDGSIAFETAGQKIALGPAAPSQVPVEASVLGVRPHDLRLVDPQHADLCGQIDIIEPIGHAQLAHIALASAHVVIVAPPEDSLRPHTRVGLKLNRERLHFFDRDGRRGT
jgi:ABC-type sugar transport system ATPase subunit